MNYNLKRPCDNCPFRREGGIPLHPARIHDIADMMLDWQGGTFPCHKTVDHDDRNTTTEKHCAGALIFADKNGNATQMMRIAGRLRMFNPDELEDVDAVWATKEEWLEVDNG